MTRKSFHARSPLGPCAGERICGRLSSLITMAEKSARKVDSKTSRRRYGCNAVFWRLRGSLVGAAGEAFLMPTMMDGGGGNYTTTSKGEGYAEMI